MAGSCVPKGTKALAAFVPRGAAARRLAVQGVGRSSCLAGLSIAYALTLSAATLAGHTLAAPLDALQESGPHAAPRSGFVEMSLDRMNDRLDLFNLRPDWAAGADNFGNLSGWRLRGGYGFTDRAWLEAGLFGRSIQYGSLEPRLSGWQITGQWRLLRSDPLLNSADISLRASTWGNSTDTVSRNNTSLGGVTLDSVSVTNPRDRQWQLGPVISWPLGDAVFSVFGSAGRGQVSVERISARLGDRTLNWSGGQFDLDGRSLGNLGQNLARSLGLDDELATVNYSFRFLSTGVGLRYPAGNWQLRGGYEYVTIRRDEIDSVIAARDTDNITYSANHTLVGEVAYRFSRVAYVFVRGQAMSNQFLAEVPFLYNGLTARRFDARYGLLTTGLVFGF